MYLYELQLVVVQSKINLHEIIVSSKYLIVYLTVHIDGEDLSITDMDIRIPT